jgi:hypothetical protein
VDSQPATTQIIERRLTSSRDGEDLKLTVLRDGTEQTFDVKLATVDTREYSDSLPGIHDHDEPEMPNVNNPGPNNLYRPTRPDDTGIDSRGDYRFRTPAFDRSRDSDARSRTYTTDRYDSRYDDRDASSRYYTPPREYYYEDPPSTNYPIRQRSFEMRSDMRDPYFRPGRNYNTNEVPLFDDDYRVRSDQDAEFPNMESPDPNDTYRPSRPATRSTDTYRRYRYER